MQITAPKEDTKKDLSLISLSSTHLQGSATAAMEEWRDRLCYLNIICALLNRAVNF